MLLQGISRQKHHAIIKSKTCISLELDWAQYIVCIAQSCLQFVMQLIHVTLVYCGSGRVLYDTRHDSQVSPDLLPFWQVSLRTIFPI